MAIPIYKQVRIKSQDKNQISVQLKALRFGNAPYVFILDGLNDQAQALLAIEQCLEELKIPSCPYPIYIIGDVSDYDGQLDVFTNIQQCPQFFNKRNKQLNVKEQQVMQKLKLKQKNMENLVKDEYFPPLKRYAKSHKLIYKVTQESTYLEDLMQKLGKKK